MTVKNYVLDINKTSLQHPSIVLRQDDYNIYTVDISVTENGKPIDLRSYSLYFLGVTPAGAKIIDSENFITNASDLAVGKFSYRFPKEATGSKGIYDVAYFRLKTTSGATSAIDLNVRVLGGIDLTADEVKDYITVDDTLRNTLVSEVFKKVDAKVDEHLATVKKGDTGPAGKDGYMPIIGGRNLLLDTGRSFTGVGDNSVNGNFDAQGGRYYLAGGKKVSDLYNQYGPSKYLTFSFDWVASGTTTSGQLRTEWSSTPWGGGIASLGPIDISSTNTSGHYSVTIPLNTGGYSTGIANGIRFKQDNLQGNITISNVKLEAGNVATDWTPAPEDVDNTYVKDVRVASGITDFNLVMGKTWSGKWYKAGGHWSNEPEGASNYLQFEYSPADNNISGILEIRDWTTNRQWRRTVSAGAWSNWVELANDSNIVHNIGNKTVAGNKTLTGLTTMLTGNYGLRVTSSGFQKTTDGGKNWVTANL